MDDTWNASAEQMHSPLTVYIDLSVHPYLRVWASGDHDGHEAHQALLNTVGNAAAELIWGWHGGLGGNCWGHDTNKVQPGDSRAAKTL